MHDCHHAGPVLYKTYSPGEFGKIKIAYVFIFSKPTCGLRKNVSSYCFGNYGASGAGSIVRNIRGLIDYTLMSLGILNEKLKSNTFNLSWKIGMKRNGY